MPITQNWWPVTQLTSLPPCIINHDKYKEGIYDFKCARIKYLPTAMFIAEVIIEFWSVTKDGSSVMGNGLYHHWKKVNDDPLDQEWQLIGYST